MNTQPRSPDPHVTGPSWLGDTGSARTPPPHSKSDDGPSTVPVRDSRCRPIPPPPVVGKYRILQPGSAGGMGIVYQAHDAELNRIVALKVIKGGVLASDEEIARFHREAQAAARLNHPNIISVYEIGQESGCPYFTMAFAAGGSLAQHRDRFAEPHAAAALLEKIARAIHYAHQRGIFHRDLKPANILFDEHGNPLVSDFGLAKLVDASLELTQAGQVLGTPAYMAPEQASGQTDQISAATDVWALGVLLYELLTGQRPFQGTSHDEQMRKVRTGEPPQPRNLNRSIDPALETVVLKCLEKEPARRYASAEALAEDLSRWLRGEPVLARPPSWGIRVRRALHRHRVAVIGLIGVAVLLAVLALVWKTSSPSVRSEEAEDRRQINVMDEQLARLNRGETVTLLGATGPPAASRWQLPGPNGTVHLDDDHFRVYADARPGMLQLLPAAPKRFRLRAEVQHLQNTGPLGRVGLYFAHGQRPASNEVIHCFFRLAFDDRVDPPLNRLRLTLQIGHDNGTTFSQENQDCGTNLLFAPAGKRDTMPWRSLAVEVTPERIRARWEGNWLQTRWDGKQQKGFDPAAVFARYSKLSGFKVGLVDPNAPFVPDRQPPRGDELGLYVEKGSAAFRSVVIEPLPE